MPIKKIPLLSVGTFGTHIIGINGKFSFTGNVPNEFYGKGFKDESEAIRAFVDWFVKQDDDFQREHIQNLRNDIFALVIIAKN